MTSPRWFDPKITLGNVLTVVALLVTLVGGYVNLKLDVARAAQDITQVQQQVQSLDNDNLPTRISLLEQTIILNKAARDKAQDELVSRLDRLQSDVIQLSNSVAALNATLTAQTHRP